MCVDVLVGRKDVEMTIESNHLNQCHALSTTTPPSSSTASSTEIDDRTLETGTGIS